MGHRRSDVLNGNPTFRTTDENWKSLKSASHQVIIKHVPTTKSKTKRNLPWITRNIKCEIRKKDRQYRKAKKSQKHEDWPASRVERQHLQKLMSSARDDYIRNVIGASLLDKGIKKKCWSLSYLIELKTWVSLHCMMQNGLRITNQAKAECLNKQFVSVFTSDDGRHLPDRDGLPTVRWTPYRTHNQ